MSHRISWFAAGVVTATVLATAILLGAQFLSTHADAQSTWQVKTVHIPLRTPAEMKTPLARPNPDMFISDWIVTLPDSCDIVITADEQTVFYRCP